jgi:hypothetical protein
MDLFKEERGQKMALDSLALPLIQRGTQWRSWLRYCTAKQKVADSIPDGVIGVDSASNRNEY